MTFPSISREQQGAVRWAASSATDIRTQAAGFVSRLARVFSDDTPATEWVVSFQRGDDKTSTLIETVYGTARGRLELSADEGGTFGRYVVEKRKLRGDDVFIWVPVWSARLADWVLTPDVEGSSAIPLRNVMSSREDINAASEALNIIYSIARG